MNIFALAFVVACSTLLSFSSHEASASEIPAWAREELSLSHPSPHLLTTGPGITHFVYLYPTDRPLRQDYALAVKWSAETLRDWFSQQLGGASPILPNPVVQAVPLDHESSFYKTNDPGGSTYLRFYQNVLNEALPKTGGAFNDPSNVWIFLVDAPVGCGQLGGGGGGGIAVMSDNDLRGLIGGWYLDCNGVSDPSLAFTPQRWIGGQGHELGHAYGLPHPPGCDAGLPSCDSDALMWSGFYYRFPATTYLRAEEKAYLLIGSYVQAQTSAHVLSPEPGLWGGPGENGRGLSIEIQDDNMFVTYYGYQPDGVKSAFYTSLGKINPATGVMTGYFAAAQNGQCYGCPHRDPQLTDLGQVRFEFTSRTSGRVFIPGVGSPIKIDRSVLRVGNTWNSRDELYGIWNETSGAAGLYFGDNLWFRYPNDSSSTTNGFSGTRTDTTRQLLGSSLPDGSSNAIFVLIDTSANYYTAIAFTPSGDHWFGRTWTYLKTSSLSGDGLPSFGNRSLGRVFSEAALAQHPAIAGPTQDVEAAFETSAVSRASATTDAASSGNPATVKIDQLDVPFDVIRRKAEELAGQMRLSQ